jgi:hypothetical protein
VNDVLFSYVFMRCADASLVADGRNALQSTTYRTAGANLAVDGNYSTVSCTNSASYPQWLAIDINRPSAVRAVNVTNDSNNAFGSYPSII